MVRRIGPQPLIAASILTLLVTGCDSQVQPSQSSNVNDPWGVVTVDSGKPIRLGVALSNLDSQSENAEAARGIELALQQYANIAGFSVEAVRVRAECSEAGGQIAATELAGDSSLVAVIGPDCVSACRSAARIFEEAHYTAISPTCADSDLTDPVHHVSAFVRTRISDASQGYLAAEYAYRELGARRVAVISDGSRETEDAASAFETRMSSLGGKIVNSSTIASGGLDMQTVLVAVARRRDVDLIYAPLLAVDAKTLLVNRQIHAELATINLLGSSHYFDGYLVQNAGQVAEGIYATGPYPTSEAFTESGTQYQSLYNQEPLSPAYAYAHDAVGILLQAILKVATRDDQGNLVIGRKALQDKIYATVNYPGLTGTLTCTIWGDCGADNLAVAQVKNGAWVVVYAP